jgi:hypothetical protein
MYRLLIERESKVFCQKLGRFFRVDVRYHGNYNTYVYNVVLLFHGYRLFW